MTTVKAEYSIFFLKGRDISPVWRRQYLGEVFPLEKKKKSLLCIKTEIMGNFSPRVCSLSSTERNMVLSFPLLSRVGHLLWKFVRNKISCPHLTSTGISNVLFQVLYKDTQNTHSGESKVARARRHLDAMRMLMRSDPR